MSYGCLLLTFAPLLASATSLTWADAVRSPALTSVSVTDARATTQAFKVKGSTTMVSLVDMFGDSDYLVVASLSQWCVTCVCSVVGCPGVGEYYGALVGHPGTPPAPAVEQGLVPLLKANNVKYVHQRDDGAWNPSVCHIRNHTTHMPIPGSGRDECDKDGNVYRNGAVGSTGHFDVTASGGTSGKFMYPVNAAATPDMFIEGNYIAHAFASDATLGNLPPGEAYADNTFLPDVNAYVFGYPNGPTTFTVYKKESGNISMMTEADGSTPAWTHLLYLLPGHVWAKAWGPPYSTNYQAAENTTAIKVGEFLGIRQTMIDFYNSDGTFTASDGTVYTSPRGEHQCQTTKKAYCAHDSDLPAWKQLYHSFGDPKIAPLWTDPACCAQ